MPPDEDEDPASQPFDARLRGRMRYDYALGSGCLAAVVLARIHATQLGHPLPASLSDAQWRITGRNILWSMPRILLDTLVTGNLARKYHCGNDMLVELFDDSEWAHEATLIAPMVYTVILSTTGMGPGRGLSPTPDQLRLVIGMLRGYVSQHPDTFDVALQVDNAFGRVHSTENDLYQGHHHFLTATKNGVRKPEEEPLKHALQYIGYAFNYSAREKDHMRGGSAFLMHLVKHVCQVLYPREFNLETFPLCFLAKEDEVCLAELLLTQLADSFHTTGGGFNAHPPGLNNTSAEMKDWVKEDWEGFWRDRRETRVGMGFWEQARCEEMDVLERGGMGPSEAASEGSMGTQQAMLSAVQAESKDLENASRDFDREAKQEEEAVVHRLERIAAHEALEGPEYAEVREWMLKRLC
ncbi:hypothetical protein P153DRAFT_347298 [Dothidotthia symphoricarpi CBS 119687]|uniref:Uncharacterized protein n=1 Tax=Dothidotthia symphoricarpi CBS 119687 TaxID=1392245 RepID=A0A6A6A5Q2_9PLEO|nr:uncharacterized protein P153DRAFT_347298 [Dothidotthia symphoricarpi CBS 119687]KAF2126237.1 hypothetical protein P153DRAFT_347298 [Dothidotthia symphoricarpi CBS 119687]